MDALRSFCAWCGEPKDGLGEPRSGELLSHGICQPCRARQWPGNESLDASPRGRYEYRMKFDEKLKMARDAGKGSAARPGTIRGDVAEIMAAGESHPAEILREVLERRGESPAWLSHATEEEMDQVESILAIWGTVKAAIRQVRKAAG